MWVVEERIEKQWPSVNDAVAAPGLVRKSRIAGQLRAHPLILHGRLKQEFRHEEEKHPLKANEADVAPDLKLVFAVKSPAFEGLNAKDCHQGGVQYRVPKRPGAIEERQQFVAPVPVRPKLFAFAKFHSVDRVPNKERQPKPGEPIAFAAELD